MLITDLEMNRRAPAQSGLATGSAAAVFPVTADTITTDTAGREAGEIKITTKNGEIPGSWRCPKMAQICRS